MSFSRTARSCFSSGRSPGVTSVCTGTRKRILRKVLFRFTGSMQRIVAPGFAACSSARSVGSRSSSTWCRTLSIQITSNDCAGRFASASGAQTNRVWCATPLIRAPLRQIDRARRDVEPGDARAQPGEDHRVLSFAAADVEDGLSPQVAEELEAALLGVGPARIAVPLEDRFLHRLEAASVRVRPAIEELRFLRQLRRMSHF